MRDGAHGLAVFAAGLDNVWRVLPLTESRRGRIRVWKRSVRRAARSARRAWRGRARRRAEPRAWPDLPAPRGRARGARGSVRGAAAPARPGGLVAGALPAAHRQPRARAPACGGRSARCDRPRGAGLRAIVVATEEARAEFSELLSHEAAGRRGRPDERGAHASPAQLLELATPILEEWRASAGARRGRRMAGGGRTRGARLGGLGRTPSRQRPTVASRLSSSGASRPGRLALPGLRAPGRVAG